MRGVGSAIPLGETVCAGALPARRRTEGASEGQGRARAPPPPNGHVRAQPLSGTEPPLLPLPSFPPPRGRPPASAAAAANMEAVNAFNQEVGAGEGGGGERGPGGRAGREGGEVTVAAIAPPPHPQPALGFRLWAARARCGAARGLRWGGPGQRSA